MPEGAGPRHADTWHRAFAGAFRARIAVMGKHKTSVVVCLLLIGACGGKPVSSDEVTVEVTAKQLVSAYEKNEVGADEKYKGKVARITGKIEKISKDPLGRLSLQLRGSLLFGGDVVCEFSRSDAKALSDLEPGEEATVIGRIDGRLLNTGSDVNVENCRLESQQGS